MTTETQIEPQPSPVAELSDEELTAIVESEAYKAWVGENGADVVARQDGVPLIFYHGGHSGVTEFNRDNPRHTGQGQHGIYFSERLNPARFFADTLRAEQHEQSDSGQSSVYAVILKMQNPLAVEVGSGIESGSIDAVPQGYDGLVNPRKHEVVVFDPAQIFIAKEMTR